MWFVVCCTATTKCSLSNNTNERASARALAHTHSDSTIFITFRLNCLIIYLLLRLHSNQFSNAKIHEQFTVTHSLTKKYSMQIENLFIKRAVFISQNVVTFCIFYDHEYLHRFKFDVIQHYFYFVFFFFCRIELTIF